MTGLAAIDQLDGLDLVDSDLRVAELYGRPVLLRSIEGELDLVVRLADPLLGSFGIVEGWAVLDVDLEREQVFPLFAAEYYPGGRNGLHPDTLPRENALHGAGVQYGFPELFSGVA